MSVQKMDGETVRAEWRRWVEEVGAGNSDVVIVVQGREAAAMIAYGDYLALQDELVRLRADRKDALEALAVDSGADYLRHEDQLADFDDRQADDNDGGGDDGGDG